MLWIFHDYKVINASSSQRFSKFLSSSHKPWATNLALTFETPFCVSSKSTHLTDIISCTLLSTSVNTLFFFQFSNSSSFASVTSKEYLSHSSISSLRFFQLLMFSKSKIFIVLSPRSLMLNQYLFFPDALPALLMTNTLFHYFESGSL